MNNSIYIRPYFDKLKDVKSDEGRFIIPVVWQVYSTIQVEADNLQSALLRAEENLDSIPLSCDPEYVEGSYEINVVDVEDAINAQEYHSMSPILIKSDGKILS